MSDEVKEAVDVQDNKQEAAVDVQDDGKETLVVNLNDEGEKPAGSTIARTIVFFIGIINLILVEFGMPALDIDPDTLYNALSVVFAAVMAIIAWWKDNPFTKAAIKSNRVMKFLKGIN